MVNFIHRLEIVPTPCILGLFMKHSPFLLHRGKRSVNLPSALRLSGHKDCSLNYVNSSVQTRMMP